MLTCYWFVVASGAAAWLVAWGRGLPRRSRDRLVVAVFFAVYVLCVCFRDISVGVDTDNYVRFFDTGAAFGWENSYFYRDAEPGFLALSALVAFFGGHELFLVLTGLLSVVPLALLYYRESEDGVLCCSFFLISLLFEMFFSGIRQSLAIGIGCIAFLYAKRRKPVPFVLAVLLAASMHQTALVLLVLYPLYHARITQRWIPFVVVGMVLVYVFREAIFDSVLASAFAEDYVEDYQYLTGESTQGSLSILFLLLALYSCVMLDPSKADADTLGYRNILLLAATIHIFTVLHPVVCRLNYYFIPFIPLALARVNLRAKPRLKPVAQIAGVALPAFFAAYFLFFKSDSLGIAPYLTCF